MQKLTKLRADVKERRQHSEEYHLSGYRPLMEETLTQLRHAASELARVSPTIRPIAERALKEYPLFEDDPPSVKREVKLLRDRCESLQRLLEEQPGWIQKLIAKIQAREPADFVHCSVTTRVTIDKRDAAPLIDVHRGLDSFAEEITEIQDRIEEAVAYWAGREEREQGHTLAEKAVTYEDPRKDDKPEIIDCNIIFDARDQKARLDKPQPH